MPIIKRKAYRLHKKLEKWGSIKRSLISLFLLPLLLGASVFILSSVPAHASLSDSLVGHWEFNEGTGTTAVDSSVAGNDGTLVQNGGSPSWVSPGSNGSGSALQFDGAGAQAAAGNTVNVGNDASLNGLSKYILSAWVKFDPGYVGNSGTWANIIGRTQGLSFSYMLYINANGHLRAHHVQSNGGVILYDSVNVIPTGQWVHIAQIADGSRIRLIINGVEDPTSAAYNGTSNSLPTANTYIGQDTRERTLLGSIDDARIYDNFSAPGGVAGGLTAWQKGDDGTAAGNISTWSDSSGNGNDTTTNGTLTLQNNTMNFNPSVLMDNGTARYSNHLGITGVNNFSTFFAAQLRSGHQNMLWGTWDGAGQPQHYANFTADGQVVTGVGQQSGTCGSTTSGGIALGQSRAISLIRSGGNTITGKQNGGLSSGPQACTASFSTGARSIGGRLNATNGTDRMRGNIAEAISYNRTVTAAEENRINSYLGIKYGLTLDQATPQNYTASNGTTVTWNATTNLSYRYNITGIGRDDNSDLNQKQSKSVNPQGIVTVANGTLAADNPSNANNFSADNSFLVFGDDNNSATAWTDTGATNTILVNYKRIQRTWKAQETGTVGNVTVGLDTADLDANLPDAISGYYLLRDSDNDGSFADEVPVQMTDNGSGQFSVGGINFTSGELFTFATFANEARVDIQVADNLTSEDGDTGTFKVKLGARPTAAVTVTFTSSDTDEGTVPVSITIQPDDWDNYDANVVTVTGVDDSPPVGDGAVAYAVITSEVTSSDTSFDDLDGSDVGDVDMFNQNNDPPGINLSLVSSNTTTEAGGCVTVRFELLSQPTAAVTIPVSLDDTTEGTLSGVSQITIQPADWDQPQNNEVTVCGVADGTVDGDIPYSLITGDPTSGDAGYNAIDAGQVADAALVNQNVDEDDDGDGVQDNEENGAPNSGDANDDGTPDRLQPHVASFVSDVTGDYATLEIDDACQINFARTVAETDQAAEDPNYEYPYGLMNFQADCGTAGFIATVKQSYFGATSTGLVLRKHNPSAGTYFNIDNPAVEQLTIGGETLAKATFQIVDGGSLDMNGSADGVIVDPAGLALQLPTPAAPSAGNGLSNTGQNVWLHGPLAAILMAISVGAISWRRILNAMNAVKG